MEPAAVLAVVVKAQGVGATNAQLKTVQANLAKTDAAGMAMATSLQKSGAKTMAAGKMMTKGLTVPILGLIAASADMSLHFGREMSLIRTQAGATGKELKYFTKEIEGMAGATKFGPDELAKALFRVRSAGFKGAKGLAVMKEGANLATLGNSDLEMTTKALTGAAKSLDLQGSKAFKHLAAEMNATVGTGDMRMEELQSALSTGVLPAFVAAGLGMRDYADALTVMTDRNVPAQMASTRLRTAVTMLVPHTKKAEEALGGIGIKSEALANIMRKQGLPQTIAYLAHHLDKLSANKANRVQIEAFGGAKSSATIEMLVQNYQELFEKEQIVGKGIKTYNEQIRIAEENPLVKLQKAWSAIQGDLVKIGNVVVPIIVPALLAMAGAIGDVVDAFGKLDPATQKTIVYIGLVIAAIGPLLHLFGWLQLKFGKTMAFIVRNNLTWAGSAEQTAATVETANAGVVASYEEVAAAAEMAAAAQEAAAAKAVPAGQMQMMMPEASAAGQMSLLGTTPARAAAPVASEAAVATEASVAGGGAAGAMAGGLAAMLPMALAAVGVGNILSSVLGHDTKGAMYKTGGAAGGALIGGIIGSVVPGIGTIAGALVGGGLGSIAGGLMKNLFNTEEPDKFDNIVSGLVSDMGKLTAATNTQKEAFSKLQGSTKGVGKAHAHLRDAQKAQGDAVKHLHQDEHQLANVRDSQSGPAAIRIQKDEQRVREASRGVSRAKHAETQAEHLHGVRLRVTKLQLEQTVRAEKSVADRRQKEIEPLRHLLRYEERHGASQGRIIQIGKKLIQDMETRQKALRAVSEAENKAATIISPKFARQLHRITSVQAENAEITAKVTRQVSRTHPIIEGMGNWWTTSTSKAKHGLKNVQQQMGPFQTETHQTFRRAKGDVKSWDEGTAEGIKHVHDKLGAFGKELGITKSIFSVGKTAGKGSAPGKQKGGMVVPGAGTGDKVPLTAMVEPGEIVHVLNKRASQDIHKLDALETLQRERPRFQAGGTLGTMHNYRGLSGDTDFYPAMGFALSKMAVGTGTHIGVASGFRTIQEQAALYAAYLAGTGNLAAAPSPNAPHVRGYAADIEPGRGTFGATAGNYGLGFTVPSEEWHIELLNKVAGATGSFAGGPAPKMPKTTMSGPQGALLKLSQAVVDKATKMAQSKLNQVAGSGTGGIPNVATGPVQSMAKQMVTAIWGSGQFGAFDALEMSEAGWDPTALNPESGAAGLAQALPASKYPPGAWPYSGLDSAKLQLQWMMGYIKERYGSPSSAWAFHQANNWYQEGGILGAGHIMPLTKHDEEDPHKGKPHHKDAHHPKAHHPKHPHHKAPSGLSKSMGSVLKGLNVGKHLPKYQGALKRLKRHIDSIGLNKKQTGRLEHLQTLTEAVKKYEEFAGNASTLTTETEVEEGEPIINQGVFKGRHEGEWLQEQLGALLRLRTSVIGEWGIEAPQLPMLKKLWKEAQNRLAAVRKAIREAEQKKNELEAKVKEIERTQAQSKTSLEKELKEIENTLSHVEHQKKPDKKTMEVLRAQIHEKKEGIAGNDKGATEQIADLKKKITTITGDNKGRVRVESALKNTLIPSIETKKTSVAELLEGIKGAEGSVEGKGGAINFMGLEGIQGAGGGMGGIGNPPVLGTVGGNILDVQSRLKQIEEEAHKAKVPGKTGKDEEIVGIEKELGLELNKREAVQRYQNSVLASFPGVKDIAMPFAGAFAKGGVMMAEVGEKGREIIAAPQGSRVIPSHEARDALSSSGSVSLVIEELIINEDGSVTVKTGGEDIAADVRKVTRQDTSRSMASTPGGLGIRRR